MKIAFITNFPAHYRVKLFEKLADIYDVDYYFFSDRKEWYWEKNNPELNGRFNSRYLRGFCLGNTRITPRLIPRIAHGGYDVVIKCINGKFVLAASFVISKLMKKKFILWTGIWHHPQNFIHKLTFQLTRYIYMQSDGIVVYGTHVRDYLVSLGIPGSKIFIGWNTVDNGLFNKPVSENDKIAIRNIYNLKNKKIILYVGRLEKEKGIEYLLQAYEQLQRKISSALFVIGSGSMKNEFRNFCEVHELQNVHLLDYVDNSELYKYYALADVLVVPSVTTKMFKEPWGLVINEAMNQGCPVIATDAVGAAVGGLIEQNINGYIIPERNVEELYKKITLLFTDDKRQKLLIRNAEKKIRTWNYNFMIKGFIDTIHHVGNNKY